MDLFISYSRRDVEIVRRLHQSLTAAGRACWVDWSDIPPASQWRNEIEEAVQQASTCLFVLSPDWVASEVCKFEFEMAERYGKRLIAVIARDVPSKQIPDRVRALDWIFCRSHDVFDGAISRIETAITLDLEYVRAHTRLQLRAKSWIASSREDGRLLRGSELAEAERWLDGASDKEPPATEIQRELINQSRLRGNDLLAQDLMLASVTTRQGDPSKLPVAVLLAIEAVRARPSRGTVEALYASLSLLGIERTSFQVGPRPLDMRFGNEGMLTVFSHLQTDVWAPEVEVLNAIREAISNDSSLVVAGLGYPSEDRLCLKHALPESDPGPYEGFIGPGPVGAWHGSVMQLETGQRLTHPAPITLAGVSPGRRFVVVACRQHVFVWITESGELHRQIELTEGRVSDVMSMAFSPDGRYCVFGQVDRATVVELQTGAVVRSVEHYPGHGVADPKLALSFTGTLVTAVDDEIRGWSLDSQGSDWVRLYHGSEVSAVAVSLTADLIASGGTDGLVRVWDTRDRLEVCRMSHGAPVRAISIGLDQEHLASADDEGRIRVWRLWNGVRTGKQRPAFVVHEGHALCPDGSVVAETHARDTEPCVLRNPGSRRVIARFPGNGFYRVAVTAGGKTVATINEYRGGDPYGKGVTIYDVASRREINRFYAHGMVSALEFGWSTRFVAVQVDKWIGIVDLQAPPDRGSGFTLGNYAGSSGLVVFNVFPDSPASKAGLQSGDRIRIMDAIGEYTLQDNRRFSGDHLKIIVEPSKESPVTRELVLDRDFESGAPFIHDVVAAFDGAAGSAIILTDSLFGYRSVDGEVVVVSLLNGIERLRRQEEVVALAIDADGDRLALGLAGGDIRIESLSEAVAPLVLHTEQEVTCIAYRRDGKTIAACSGNRLCVWDVESGALLHESTLSIRSAHVALTSDGSSVVAISDQPMADQMRPVATSGLLELAQRWVGRTLTDEEWNEAMPGRPRPL